MDAHLAPQLNPSESDDDFLNTPFTVETSPPPVIRQVSCRSCLHSVIIDPQFQHRSTAPSTGPHPDIDSLYPSRYRTRCSALRSGRRSTCSLSQHRASRHSPTDTAVTSALQGLLATSTCHDKSGLCLAFRAHSKKKESLSAVVTTNQDSLNC
ncbi:hypothetical protein XENOCAPTIV_018448 [Xenoophorus captivus]|uniref:Uncharacterized protein n=1 Tax=Xenoophorus captivus TaxID=1517983 RepID=A0ABV0R2E5_9TELE